MQRFKIEKELTEAGEKSRLTVVLEPSQAVKQYCDEHGIYEFDSCSINEKNW